MSPDSTPASTPADSSDSSPASAPISTPASASAAAYGTPTTTGPQQIRPYQAALNRFMRILLRTPLISRGIGSRLLTITVVGRKTGNAYVIPVSYTRHENYLLVGTVAKKWVSNLRPGVPVEIRVQGKRQLAEQVVFRDEANVIELFDIIARDNHTNAKFSGIGFNPDGSPNQADLHQAWELGAAVIRFSLG